MFLCFVKQFNYSGAAEDRGLEIEIYGIFLPSPAILDILLSYAARPEKRCSAPAEAMWGDALRVDTGEFCCHL